MRTLVAMAQHPLHVHQLESLDLPNLYAALHSTGLISRLLAIAFEEDLGPARASHHSHHVPSGSGDVSTDVSIDPGRTATADVVARSEGMIAGLATLPELVTLFAPSVTYTTYYVDGQHAPAMTTVARLVGPLDEILGLERTLLNLLGRLCGIATRTARFVKMLPSACPARIFDTRKTTPGLRLLEKYAVRCGGGYNHRIGLYDAVLLKDNHLAGTTPQTLASFVATAADRAKQLNSMAFIEVEVDTLDQFAALLTLPKDTVNIVLLDNMPPEMLQRAVAMRAAAGFERKRPGGLELEASGGVTLDTLPAIAASGVDRISIGGLTHSAVVLDVALDIIETGTHIPCGRQ